MRSKSRGYSTDGVVTDEHKDIAEHLSGEVVDCRRAVHGYVVGFAQPAEPCGIGQAEERVKREWRDAASEEEEGRIVRVSVQGVVDRRWL